MLRNLTIIFLVLCGLYVFSIRAIPQIQLYGVSFSKLHSDELGLDWKETYLAILNDLGAKRLRLSAHWPMVEPKEGVFHFDEMDFQMREAAAHGASVILAVGRKTPGWPECHTPDWASSLDAEKEHAARIAYITAVVNRYKDSPALEIWQVENEPFLNYARTICGRPDENFFAQEIALVRELDPAHKILVTDGGEFGLWYKARTYGDVFGSTMYLYVYSSHIGYWRYPIGGWFFRAKQNVLDLFKKTAAISIEVGLEPWLNKGIAGTPIDEQLQHMNMDRFNDVLNTAQKSGFAEHYLWGAEWWYYMTKHGHNEFWNKAKALFTQ